MQVFCAIKGIAGLRTQRARSAAVPVWRARRYARSRERINALTCGFTQGLRRDDKMSFCRGATALKVFTSARVSDFSAALALTEHGPITSSGVVDVAMKVEVVKGERRVAGGRWICSAWWSEAGFIRLRSRCRTDLETGGGLEQTRESSVKS